MKVITGTASQIPTQSEHISDLLVLVLAPDLSARLVLSFL